MAIPDEEARRLAETTFDRNVVVVAGAGTGKTTLLVNRLVHLLIREPKPIEITRMVALTFTNKAATEMKVRLRERLQALRVTARGQAAADPGAVSIADLRERYGLSSDEIDKRAKGAWENLEKAQLGTLHSFAAHVLRLHPLESGVDPAFETDDDGLRFDEHFSAQWEVWLDGELGPNGPNHALWRRLLAEVGLAQIREVAYELRSELIPLDDLCSQAGEAVLSQAFRDWAAAKRTRAAALLAAHDRPKRRKIESMLAVAQELFSLLLERGHDAVGTLDPAQREELDRDLGDQPAGWSKDEFAEAGSIIRVAKQTLTVDGDLIQDLLKLLTPFAQRVRAAFLAQGWISFDGLLARTRTLLRDHPAVRERLKHEYHAVLVDEFQDTDPVQYEIILYLAERAGRCGATWRDVELDPGKLFIVGDPKQSIYAFRRADIEAFEQVVRKVRESGGVVYELATNFRSHGRLLEVVNPIFDRLLRQQENVQPPNVPLIVRPDRRGGVTRPGVELRLVTADDDEEEFDAATATRIEA
ncbi:MAG: UvrD-helicase domain-containing protein, partial [Terriglobales bacterium]